TDANDERIKKTCEFILNNSQHRESGGFSARGSDDNGGSSKLVIPCLTGNMIWALIKFGYLEDSRVQNGIDCILKYQRFDDGIDKSPSGWPYEKKEKCWGKHTCHMGVVKNLKALSEIPPNMRSNEVEETINRAVDYLLNHRIYKKSHYQNVIAKQEWTQFGFPLMWKIDALEVLDILTRLGYKDDRMRDAFDLVISKQDKNGRWKLEKSFNGRMQVRVEQVGKESKWITLNALKMLKKYYDLTN
ncbi:MAG: nitrogen fixation protein NifH, partial [Promethearchaeota archaeon]